MCFDSHIRAVIMVCKYHTCALLYIRKQLTSETLQTIACSVLSGPGLTTATHCCLALLLQLSTSYKGRITTSLVSSVSVNARSLLKSLHWLPIQQHIQYKLALISYDALSKYVPPYARTSMICYSAKSTKKRRRWGRCSIYRNPSPSVRTENITLSPQK